MTAVLGPLATYAEPHAYDLCEVHSERMSAPRGWRCSGSPRTLPRTDPPTTTCSPWPTSSARPPVPLLPRRPRTPCARPVAAGTRGCSGPDGLRGSAPRGSLRGLSGSGVGGSRVWSRSALTGRYRQSLGCRVGDGAAGVAHPGAATPPFYAPCRQRPARTGPSTPTLVLAGWVGEVMPGG